MVEPVWHNFYEIGIDFIDEDHKNLIQIMNDIQNSCSSNCDTKIINNLLNKFISEARNHFQKEEDFLKETGYAGLENHRDFHRMLLKKADMTKNMCENSALDNNINDCIYKMIRLVIDEIFKGDIQFKAYLEEKGYIKN